MGKTKKILIIVGGGVKHLNPFIVAGKKLGIDLTCSSFSKMEYVSGEGEIKLFVEGKDLADFDVVYLRLVGKRYEDAALLVFYCRSKGVRVVDRIYETNGVIRIPLPKSIEGKMLSDAGIPLPKTYFGRTKKMIELCPKLFGFPFVIKGTTGKQGHAVWSPKDIKELVELSEKFTPKERLGERFMAQEFIKASQRNRIFVIGGKAIAGITRPTRWRARFIEKINGEFKAGLREPLNPIPEGDAKLAINAAKAVKIDIGGVDIIHDDLSGTPYVLEVNSAPRWAALKRETNVDIEREILKFLTSLDKF